MSKHRRSVSHRSKRHVQEIIGRSAINIAPAALGLYGSTVDTTSPDFAFWDGVAKGTNPDYMLGALFAEPMCNILSSWTFGDKLTASVEGDPNDPNVQYTNAQLDKFLTDNFSTLIATDESSLGLGDDYLVVNADGSLTPVPPHEVEVLTTPVGSLNVTGYKITSKLPTQTIVDEYTLKGRTRTVTTGEGAGSGAPVFYPNLIGTLPMVQFSTKKGRNELHGRPYFARLRRLFSRYDKVLNKAADGVELLGNPKPAVQGVEDPKATLAAMATGKTEVLDPATGKMVERYNVDFSKLPMIVVGKGGRFEFVAPTTGFTADAEKMLGIMFLLMLQYSGIPEWVWGGAIASSNASVDAQLPAFVWLIKGLRMKREKQIVDLLSIWMLYRALYDPRIVLSRPRLGWQPVVADDKKLLLDYLKFVTDRGLITDKTALAKTDLVEDPAKEVEAAREEQAANTPPDDQVDNAINDFLSTA
ncbi:MAG: hypothetical protein KF716_08710 [Anaerolineae bacterium]|nr:hypothetical protein [Anaerolineae bacterium]